MQIKSLLFHLTALSIITIIQTAFLSSLSLPFNSLNLVLLTILFLLFIENTNLAYIYTGILGMSLDLYSIYSFGIITISLFLSLLIIDFIYHNILTNHSFFTLIILFSIFTLLNYFFKLSFIYLSYYIGLSDYLIKIKLIYLKSFLYEFLVGVIVIMFVYFIYYSLNKKLKLFFLTK